MAATSAPEVSARRLHPAVIVLGPLGQLVPLAALALFGLVARGGAAVAVLAVFALASVVAATLKWAFFRWEVGGGNLIITEGVLQRQRRVIPLSRIHTVDLARPLWHRLLGVVEVHVETVGGGETEGQLDALGTDDAARLRALLLGLTPQVRDPGTQPAPPLATLSPGMLIIAGLTGGRIGVAAALVGFTQQVAGDRIFGALDDIPALGITVILLLAVGVMVLVFTLSVVATAITFWGFELRREGSDLTVRRGLLEQRYDTVPLGRVQGVVVQENLLRRPFGLATVQVVVAGRAGGDTAAQQALVLPLGTRAQAFALVEEILGAGLGVPGEASMTLTAMPRQARDRRIRRAVAATVLTTAALAVPLGWTGLVGLASALLWVPLGLAGYRALGHGRVGGVVIARQGALVRTTTMVPLAKVQSTGMTRTLFQRRLGLATAQVHIATTTRASTVELIDLDHELASRQLVELLHAGRSPTRTVPPHG